MKKKLVIFIPLIIISLIYGLLLELSLNTLVGWGIFLAILLAFIILYFKILSEKKLYIKLLSWAAFLLTLFIVYKISYPPYALTPAVKVKNPEVTDVVSIDQGQLTGVYNADKTVEVYTGIPYAKAPVGDLRWKEPEDAEGWEGIRTCDHFAPMFMQSENSTLWNSLVSLVIYNHFNWFDPGDNYREAMSEDALYVNIWKPEGDVSDCPVLFFIHGGSLQTGQPSYDQYNGEAYARRGIVFVDFGYRLNVFGYFSDEDLISESPNGTTGNYGLLDQIKALEWVNENISAFGGDPGNITIAGESAGASSVNAICISPLAKGLFRRAIGESSSICVNTPYHTFRSLSDALKMKGTVYEAMNVSSIEDLRKIDAKTLVKAMGEYNSMTVDGYAIPEQPALIYQKGENNEEALLSGYNATEADVFTILGTKVDSSNYENILKEKLGDAAEDIIRLYPAGSNPKEQYNYIMSAAWFAYSHYTWSRYMADEGRPVYEYWFTKENKGLSVNHAGEMPYFYGNLSTQHQNYDESDYELSDTIMDYIENYVRTGDPNGEGLPKWDDFSMDENKVMELGNDVKMTDDMYMDIYEALDKAQGF